MPDHALAELIRIIDTYGDSTLGIQPGDLSKPRTPTIEPLRITRRGNVYDDTLRRVVFPTWGLGSIKERKAIAQAWLDAGKSEGAATSDMLD